MKENLKETKNKAPTQPKKVEKEIITLKGFTTSQVQQALKGSKTQGQNPYPARVFLKTDNQEQDIPVIFRIRCRDWLKTNSCCEWTKPPIKKGSYLSLRGLFEKPLKSNRLSFTAYSYQLNSTPFLKAQQVSWETKYFSHGGKK